MTLTTITEKEKKFISTNYSNRNLRTKKPSVQYTLSTTSGSATTGDFFQENSTTTQIFDTEMSRIEYVAKIQDFKQFTESVNQINWETFTLASCLRVIQLALNLEMHSLAKLLTDQAIQIYPSNTRLRKYERVLAPAKMINNGLPPYPQAEMNINWLKEHHTQYKGQWVALKEGILLASAPTFKELTSLFEYKKNSRILVTRV